MAHRIHSRQRIGRPLWTVLLCAVALAGYVGPARAESPVRIYLVGNSLTWDTVPGKLVHSPAYFRQMVSRLRKRFPERSIRQTYAIDLLDQIDTDIRRGEAPFASLAELHRDKIHMKLDSGRYLMHNAMRAALGQPASA